MREGSNTKRTIAPSILSADFSRLGAEVKAVESAGCDWIHIDVMDGHFVPQITVGPGIVRAVRKVTRLPLDVHLMVEEPNRQIEGFAAAGADIIAVHQEACPALSQVLETIRAAGAKPAVAINPETTLAKIEGVLDRVDMVVVMSVNPGRAGQEFIESATEKIASLAKLRRERGGHWLIEVDGGIKPENARKVADAGADVLVAGSAIFGSPDYAETIRALRS